MYEFEEQNKIERRKISSLYSLQRVSLLYKLSSCNNFIQIVVLYLIKIKFSKRK